MDEKDLPRARVVPLSAENCYSRSNDMEVILRGKGLWKYVSKFPELEESGLIKKRSGSRSVTETQESACNEKSEVQKRDLALAYIPTSVGRTCKAIERKARCPREACNLLRTIFHAVSEAAIEANLSTLQSVSSKKGEQVIQNSRRVLEIVDELESAGHIVSEIEQKKTLQRGLPQEYDFTAEAIIIMPHKFNQVVSKLIVRETQLKEIDTTSERALVKSNKSRSQKCLKSGKYDHVSKNIFRF